MIQNQCESSRPAKEKPVGGSVRASLARLGLLSLVLVTALPAWSLDLRQAYEAAYANDATVRAARSGTEATRERIPQARSQLLPNISLNATRNRNDLTSQGRDFRGQPTRSETEYFSDSQTLTVRQSLYRPYQTAQLRQARAQVEDAEALLVREEQGLLVRVGEAFFEALLARDQLTLIAAQKLTYTTQLDAARKGLAAGSGTRTDVDEAQARVDLTLAQELEARQNEIFTRQRLEVLTGENVGESALASLDTSRFKPDVLAPSLVEDWIARAEAASPELRSLRAQVEAARQEIEKAKAGHKPTLDLVAQWARTNSDTVTSVNSRYDNKTIGLQLSVPIYAGGYVSSTVRQAVASLERVRELMEAQRRDLGIRVHREFRGATEGVLRIAALEQAVRSAELAVDSNQKSAKAGSRTTIDVLNAEQQKTTAQRDLAQARYVYLVSLMRLQSLAGEDEQVNIAQTNAWLRP